MGDIVAVRADKGTVQEIETDVGVPKPEENTTNIKEPETEQETPGNEQEESTTANPTESERQEESNAGTTEVGNQGEQADSEKDENANKESNALETEGEDTPKTEEDEKEKKESPVFSEQKDVGITISTDRTTGIGQIQALIPDPIFAAAVYDAFVAAGYMGDGTTTLEQLLAGFTGEINAKGTTTKVTEYTLEYFDPSIPGLVTKKGIKTVGDDYLEEARAAVPAGCFFSRAEVTASEEVPMVDSDGNHIAVKSIEGILYLRKVKSINLSNNQIEDLSPLDINKAIALDIEGTSSDGKKWFREYGLNTTLNLGFNPIQNAPALLPGRLEIKPPIEQTNFSMATSPIIYIKGEGWTPVDKDISLPTITIGNQLAIYSLGSVVSNSIPGLNTNEVSLEGDILSLKNMQGSGEIRVSIGTHNRIEYWGADAYDTPTPGGGSVKFLLTQKVRIYNEVIELPSETQTAIEFTKYIEGTDEAYILPGAKFNLYKAEKQSDGTYQAIGEPVNKDPYETSADGKIIVTESLAKGSYCFVEKSAPEGFKLDQVPIGFEVGGGTIKISGGDSGFSTSADEKIYIDRYSSDIEIAITPDEGNILKNVYVEYVDKDNQVITEVFSATEATEDEVAKDAATNAADWINDNKGTNDKEGLFNGTVKIKPVYEQKVSEKATNEYKTKDFEFEKVDADTGEKLAGVEFRLSCMHEHNDTCGGKADPQKCSHPHVVLSKGASSDQKGCTWTTKVTSEADKNVSFTKLVTGKYKLEEIKTAGDSYILPEGDWSVEVDTEKDTIQITPSNDKMPGIDLVKGEIYYQLKNQKTVPFSFTKVDAENTAETLQGAEFKLYRLTCTNTDQDHIHDDTCWTDKLSVTSDAAGLVDFGRLATGTYKLLETKAPNGFILPGGYWILTVDPGGKTPIDIKHDGEKKPPAFIPEADGSWKVPNLRVQILPVSGGMGTLLFTIGGLFLIGGAVLILFIGIRKKKGSDTGGGVIR